MTTTTLDRASTAGLVAAGLAAAAGMIELAVGSNSWTGDKNEPTTLGVLTIVLAGIMAASAPLLIRRRPSSASSLASAAGMAIPALITVTTAGRFALPGAIVGVAAGALAIADARSCGSIRQTIDDAWPTALIAVLVVIYLAFGVVAGPIGLLGILGAAAVIAAFALERRSTRLAAAVLVIGVVPFAAATWWSVVIPLTAVLLLAIGLPHIHNPRRIVTSTPLELDATDRSQPPVGPR